MHHESDLCELPAAVYVQLEKSRYFMMRMGLSVPKRCKPCRKLLKQKKAQQAAQREQREQSAH
jgi:hypothetical protein